MEKFSRISTETVRKNKYWEYKLDKYVLPTGISGDYHYVNSRGATMVIPRLHSGHFILTKQYRYLNRKYSIEFPGGGVKPGFSPKENALEELKEETGIIPSKIIEIGQYNPYNGVSNEICYVFLVDDFELGSPSPDDSEEIEIIKISKEEIISKIQEGEIWDGMTLAAWSIYYFSKLCR